MYIVLFVSFLLMEVDFFFQKTDLSDNISVEKSSVEAKMESLKQQIRTLQVRNLLTLPNFLILK